MSAVATTPIDLMQATIAESFAKDFDGLWYPKVEGLPLVRITVTERGYMMERRRKPTAGWTRLVSVDASEFDPIAFRRWVASWPLAQD